MAYDDRPTVTLRGVWLCGKKGEYAELKKGKGKDAKDFVVGTIAVRTGEVDGERRDDDRYTVFVRGALAEYVAETIPSASPVVIHAKMEGRVETVLYEDRDGNEKDTEKTVAQFTAYDMGPSGRFGLGDSDKGGGKSTRSRNDDEDDEKPTTRRRRSSKSDDDEGDDEKPTTRRRRSRAVDADDNGDY